MSEPVRWLARPYESDTWIETDVQPTDELRRWVEFKPIDDGRRARIDAILDAVNAKHGETLKRLSDTPENG